jgi:L-lactate dehydrogenase (cytochrome)
VKRQLPRWKNIKPLLGWSLPKFPLPDRKLKSVVNLAEMRLLAKKRVPKAVFDYVDGGANDELAYARSQAIYSRVEFKARVLRDVSKIDLSTNIAGQKSALPIIFAPTGYTRMMHYEGEVMVAKFVKKIIWFITFRQWELPHQLRLVSRFQMFDDGFSSTYGGTEIKVLNLLRKQRLLALKV